MKNRYQVLIGRHTEGKTVYEKDAIVESESNLCEKFIGKFLDLGPVGGVAPQGSQANADAAELAEFRREKAEREAADTEVSEEETPTPPPAKAKAAKKKAAKKKAATTESKTDGKDAGKDDDWE